MHIKKKNLSSNLLNLLIILLPISLILGNLIVNINILLIIFFGIYLFNVEIFKIGQKNLGYLLYSFFFYIIVITFINNYSITNKYFLDKEIIFKAIAYLRFLFLFLVLNKAVEKNVFNIKYFFIVCAFLSFVVGFDILIQVITGTNIIGNPIFENRPSGFFGTETIAGGYIQKFCLFFIFLISMFSSKFKNKKILFFYFLLSSIFFFIVIITTNNRMPLILYIFSLGLILIIKKRFSFLFLISTILVLIFSYAYLTNLKVKNSYNSFYNKTIEIVTITPKMFYTGKTKARLQASEYVFLFNSGIQVWKQQKLFGNGLKSFRKKCKINKFELCKTLPHNQTIEILTDTGLIGFFLIYSIIIVVLFQNYKVITKKEDLFSNIKFMPFFIILFFEFFPMRSSGSFFTTNNSTIIFLMLGLIFSIRNKDLSKKNL